MREADPDYEEPEDEDTDPVPYAIAWDGFLRRQLWTDERVLGRQSTAWVWRSWTLYQLSCQYGLE